MRVPARTLCSRSRSPPEDPAVLERPGGRRVRPATRPVRSMPAAARSFGFVRINGSPLDSILPRTLRPIGVRTVNTRWNSTRSTKRTPTRPTSPSIRNGMCPVSGPASIVSCSPTTSSAISAPEFPAPATSTGPGRSCCGPRYAALWSCVMRGSSSDANSGIAGTCQLDIATTTLSLSNPSVARVDPEPSAVPRERPDAHPVHDREARNGSRTARGSPPSRPSWGTSDEARGTASHRGRRATRA